MIALKNDNTYQQKVLGFLRIYVRKKSSLFWFTIEIISNWKTLQVFKKLRMCKRKRKWKWMIGLSWLIFIGPFECFQQRWKNRILFIWSLMSQNHRIEWLLITLHENSKGSSFIFFSLHFKEVWLHLSSVDACFFAGCLYVVQTAWLSCRNSREKRLKRHLRYYYP